MYVDTETLPTEIEPGVVEQIFRFGVAYYVDYSGHTAEDEIVFEDVSLFWDWIISKTGNKKKLYFIAHNVDFDFRVLDGFRHLRERGFETTNLIADAGKWISDHRSIIDTIPAGESSIESRSNNNNSSITVLDSLNWFKSSLSCLGETVGLPKLSMPDFSDSLDVWIPYCQRDVQILRRTVEGLMDFVKSENMGNFGCTLAKQAMNAYRHRFMTHEIVIHTQPDVIEIERSAYCGGRTEAFVIGRLPIQEYYKLDINSQYPYVMRQNPFPRHYLGRRLIGLSEWTDSPKPGIMFIADCTIETDTPNVPVRHHNRLCFPVGSFRVRLCEPEYRLAVASARSVHCHALYLYASDLLFREWVDVLYELRKKFRSEGNQQYQYFVKILMNSLYGKFGQRCEEWEIVESCPVDESWYRTLIDLETGTERTLKAVGGQIWERVGKKEGWDSLVAIAACVTSYARAYLWELIVQAGRENVFYCDTDSLIVNEKGRARLENRIDPDRLGALKVEGVSQDFVIRNLKDYTFGNETKVKGVSKKAIQTDENTYIVEQWEHLSGAVHRGHVESVRVNQVVKVLRRMYEKGSVQDDGTVQPFVLNMEIDSLV